ncbi:DNA repair protein [Collinsella sp. zg1085]|uniref:Y-family DNA polymerase n=1 Tax=Collinsella sp. zg1085 TaxID=2844380 RepID=UPI001C0D016E|nr:DNA repair protein [Collinsella sp. zg1085]QWT18173.1 DNA repair protein [Collinsella sp. zg1085]
MTTQRTYICIDLKSFYASVECADRGLDPFTTKLVVADPTRGEKTICLAVSPALKALGISGRPRIFELPRGINYIKARPRMRRYMEVSAQIYGIYLEYMSADDIHIYSIDECFIDATSYLKLYQTDAVSFAQTLMHAVLERTGIHAAAGIGENLFLAKVALDITAKHTPQGISELTPESFRKHIWPHRPITDIWGIGKGIATRLAAYHVYDLMGIAALNPDILYKEFGVNAEYLIDHAHGKEPVSIAEIKAYKPRETSMVSGQTLMRDYTYDEALIIVREMLDAQVLSLVEKGLVAAQISLFVGYSKHGLARAGAYIPTHGGGQRKLLQKTNSRRRLWVILESLYKETVSPSCLIRRISIGFKGLLPETYADVDLFTDIASEAREHNLAQVVNTIKGRYGANALLRGTSFKPGATGRERNEQVGGHHA